MKIDLHCHSEASHDCSTPLELIPGRCRAQGIKVQAITDHDEVWGARKLAGSSDLVVIVGEEVSTRDGELIGLFLQERIEPGLSAERTVEAVREQGGLVLLPHGFDPLKRYRLRPEVRDRLADRIDIVEGFNTRVSLPFWNSRAVGWALARGLPLSGGSDAHTLRDVGSAWVEVPERRIEGPEDLLEALADVRPAGRWVHPLPALAYKLWDRFRRR